MNQNTFKLLIEEIDDILKERGIPIHARPIHAIREIAAKLKITLKIAPLDGTAIPGNYTGDSLSHHIVNWFDPTPLNCTTR